MKSNIKALRKQAVLTQQQLARHIRKARSTVAEYELSMSHPPLETLWEIASVLAVPVDTLYERPGPEETPV